MSKNILFIMGGKGTMGHLNGSFRLAHFLKDKGYNITYAYQLLEDKRYIKAQGFGTINCPYALISSSRSSFFSQAHLDFICDELTGELKLQSNDRMQRLRDAIGKLQPQLIFLDSAFYFIYPYFPKQHPPVVFLESMVSRIYDKRYPPLMSSLVPHESIKYKIVNHYIWQKFLLKKWYLGIKSTIYGKLFRNRTRKLQPTIEVEYEREKFFGEGVKGLPEIVLSPKSFDFPDKYTPENQLHFGLPNLIDRRNTKADYFFEKELDKILKKGYDKLIYCSLGTLNVKHYKNSWKFLNKVIKAFADLENYGLIISSGEVDQKKLIDPTSNIHLYKFVPQIKVLRHCDIMITHGGLNSVFECIQAKVPMIAYPLNLQWDQPGDAGRLVYHGLGLQGNVRKESIKGLKSRIKHLVDHQTRFQESLVNMNDRMQAEYQPEKIIAFLEKEITKNGVPS